MYRRCWMSSSSSYHPTQQSMHWFGRWSQHKLHSQREPWKECWDRSLCAFVHDDAWVCDEHQIGAQAGNYVLLQANSTKQNKTLKKLILSYRLSMGSSSEILHWRHQCFSDLYQDIHSGTGSVGWWAWGSLRIPSLLIPKRVRQRIMRNQRTRIRET